MTYWMVSKLTGHELGANSGDRVDRKTIKSLDHRPQRVGHQLLMQMNNNTEVTQSIFRMDKLIHVRINQNRIAQQSRDQYFYFLTLLMIYIV